MLVQLLTQISVVAQLHDHVEIVRRLESIHQLQYVAMIKLFHDKSFRHSISDLVVADELLLRHALHGINFTTITLLYFEDLAEGAFSEDLDHFEIGEF